MSHWEWHVHGYYNDTVKPPKTPGYFAVEIGGITKEALTMDISILLERKDIGRVVLIDPNRNEEILHE